MILNCIATRALHIDVTEDYSTDSVLQVLRQFVSLRGCPSIIYSDKGSQLIAAWVQLKDWAATNKIRWKTAPAEGQYQNG